MLTNLLLVKFPAYSQVSGQKPEGWEIVSLDQGEEIRLESQDTYDLIERARETWASWVLWLGFHAVLKFNTWDTLVKKCSPTLATGLFI